MTTVDVRFLPAEAGPNGYRRLAPAPGEPHRAHPGAGAAAGAAAGRPIFAFAHLSDTHVMDHQSPARVELLDRYSDPDLRPPGDDRVVGTYRPQELFTIHVLESMVRAVNEIARGPVTGAPLDFAIVTGDLTDNAQGNELENFLAVLNGECVCPDSGDPTRYEGVADSGDPRYWHPEGEAFDRPRTQYGFPGLPGVLAAARRPFQATGLEMPWYSVYGNHDNQLQGTLPSTDALDDVATGQAKLIAPPAGLPAGEVLERLEAGDVSALDELVPGGRQLAVTGDLRRGAIARADHLRAHLSDGGSPSGHGYSRVNLESGTCHYAFDVGERVRCIVLDTVNPYGGWQGSLDPAQLDWLARQLEASGDRIVVLFSHHPLETLVNDRAPAGVRRVLADELRALLLAHPCVALWVNGHVHRHGVTPVVGDDGAPAFWQITTASHIDWPQQSRIIEVVESSDGDLTVICTVFDSAAAPQTTEHGSDPASLAALSRELSANCWQTRDAIVAGHAGAGAATDRNVVLTLAGSRPPAETGKATLRETEVADHLLSLVDALEAEPYGGEQLSQRAHALQAAALALQAGATDALVAAALLHDLGYSSVVRDAAPYRAHERAAAHYLRPLLGDGVADLVGHHVEAKRYLVAVDVDYASSLSEASSASLRRQGGPLDARRRAVLERLDWWPEALQLRRFDDAAKVPGLVVPAATRLHAVLSRLAAAAAG